MGYWLPSKINGFEKTTITDKLLRHEWMENCVYINPDFTYSNKNLAIESY